MKSAPLKVQKVGAYNISVAPTLADLQTRAPWAKFNIDPGHVGAILSGMASAYPTGFAFVVAEGDPAAPSIEQGGFSIVYRDSGAYGCFFPTAHEALPGGDGAAQVSI